jgi:hypothetical protein
VIRALSRRYTAWETTALTCPHRQHLRRYRWPLTALCTIRISTAWAGAIHIRRSSR